MTTPKTPAPAAPATAPAPAAAAPATAPAKAAATAATAAPAAEKAPATKPAAPAPAAAAPASAPADKPAPAVPSLDDADKAADTEPSLDADLPESDEQPEEADAGEKPADGDADKDKAPIVYDFGDAPEGLTYREPVLEVYRAALQKHGIAPEVAKDLLDTVLPAIQRDAVEQQRVMVDELKAEHRAEMERRHGQKAVDVVRMAKRALARSSERFQAFVRGSVLAVDPDFIDLLAANESQRTNDRPPRSSDRSTAPRDLDPLEEIAQGYDRSAARHGASGTRG